MFEPDDPAGQLDSKCTPSLLDLAVEFALKPDDLVREILHPLDIDRHAVSSQGRRIAHSQPSLEGNRR